MSASVVRKPIFATGSVMLTPIAAFTLLPFVDVIRSPHPPGVRFALDSPLEGGIRNFGSATLAPPTARPRGACRFDDKRPQVDSPPDISIVCRGGNCSDETAARTVDQTHLAGALKPLPIWRGTENSNPVPSSAESRANPTRHPPSGRIPCHPRRPASWLAALRPCHASRGRAPP
jgi:hypothetical protein